MAIPTETSAVAGGPAQCFRFRFTPAEWRDILNDGGFLGQPDNSYRPPRRLMGIGVDIIPDHRHGWPTHGSPSGSPDWA